MPADIIDVLRHLFGPPDPSDALRFSAVNSYRTESPEKNLWFEVLKVSLMDYQEFLNKGKEKQGKEYRGFNEIFNWIFNPVEEERQWFGTFDNLCQLIGLEPSYLRKELILWTQQNYGKEHIRSKKIRFRSVSLRSSLHA